MFGLLNTAGIYMPPLILSAHFSADIAGMYSMANMLIQVPSIFIGQAISLVFIQRASIAKYAGTLNIVVLKTYSLLWKLSCFPILIISIFTPLIFSIVLGEKWAQSAYFSIALVPWIIVAFVFSPMSAMYSILDRQESAFIMELIYFIMRAFALYIGAKNENPLMAVFLFSLSGVIVLLYRLTDILKSLDISMVMSLLYPCKELMLSLLLIAAPFFLLKNNMLILAILLTFIVVYIYLYSLYKFLKYNKLI